MFKTLLLQPRTFFRHFDSVKNGKHVIILLVLAGISRAFDQAISNNKGDNADLLSVIAFSVILGGLLGWITFYIYAGFISFMSGWIGKSMSVKSVVQVMAYASVPMILSLVILGVQILIFGNQIFQSQIFIAGDSFEFFLYYALAFIPVLLGLYSFFVFLLGISEVHEVSLGKAAVHVLSPLVALVLIVVVLIAIFAVL